MRESRFKADRPPDTTSHPIPLPSDPPLAREAIMTPFNAALALVGSPFKATAPLNSGLSRSWTDVIVNLLEREVDSAGDVRRGVRYCGQHVEDDELRIVQAAVEFVAGDFGVGGIFGDFDLGSHALGKRLIHKTAGGK